MSDTVKDSAGDGSSHSELFPRSSGILLHPTSLPGRFGIGDFGPQAYAFVDWLVTTGQSLWQVLPLGPTSYGDSPYQTLSSCAGNTNLISPEKLVDGGWLDRQDLDNPPDFPVDRVDFGWVIKYKNDLLGDAFTNFVVRATGEQKDAFALWCEQQAGWLDHYALYCVLKDRFTGNAWASWPENERRAEATTLAQLGEQHAAQLKEYRFRQWIFFTQWLELKAYANERAIRIIGDLPIFVAHDSCDVWANQRQFQLAADGSLQVQAGVPPDYFSATGQLWGNPLYDWERMVADGYRWWLDRLRASLAQVDIVRLDHFRGFEAYWEVPGDAGTAVDGRWVQGPGADFFTVIGEHFTDLPFIAEDLGVITRRVERLRDRFGLPGMKVLQFAWSDPENTFLPHSHPTNCVVYSGTHDNAPTRAWWRDELDAASRVFIEEYLDRRVTEPHWTMIRQGMMSPAHTCIATMQDVLGLDREGFMNQPGVESGNWDWRLASDWLATVDSRRLERLTWLYRRRPDQQDQEGDDDDLDAGVDMACRDE